MSLWKAVASMLRAVFGTQKEKHPLELELEKLVEMKEALQREQHKVQRERELQETVDNLRAELGII